MKCLILAGGCGDRLWPLSRKNYPKQFMEINENRSLLQETVVRNLSLCDEFLIVTGENWHFILEGQLKAFQGLRYRCFLEQEPRKTAAAIALVCMLENPTELIYVVAADTLIEGQGYQETVLRAKELAASGSLVAFGIPVTGANTAYGYIRCRGEEVLSFTEKPDRKQAEVYAASGDYLWNSGNFLFQAGAFLQELKKLCPQVYETCRAMIPSLKKTDARIVLWQKELLKIPALSVEKAVFERTDNVKVVQAPFAWQDIGRLEDLEQAPVRRMRRRVIEKDCDNVTVINESRDRLVVANGLQDAIVVDAGDAVYIGKKGSSEGMKEIMRDHEEDFGDYFENAKVTYRPYGMYEVLAASSGYQVKKVTIFPGCAIGVHRHKYRSEHWSVVEGCARISVWTEEDGSAVTRDYAMNESIFVPVGARHMVSNPTDKNVSIIEVGIGRIVEEEDIIRFEEPRREAAGVMEAEPIVKLQPAYKDYLWGGSRLREQFHKNTDLQRIAESWELSAHEAGQSVLAEGRYKGMLFGEYLNRIGKAAWGWKCQSLDRFPVLIKLLDAKEDLSIQVHPDDEYALTNEREYGKNEMWYILDCAPGAFVYCGFEKETTPEEIRARIANGTLTEILRKIPVEKGDAVFIPAGCVHAVRGGILLCEIQQNSDSTYRLYDYNRTDRYNNRRPLHVDKALEVLERQAEETRKKERTEKDAGAPLIRRADQLRWIRGDGYQKCVIGSCKYFESLCYEIEEAAVLECEDSSFLSVLAVEGEGLIEAGEKTLAFRGGDSFFVPAGKRSVRISGKSRCIVTYV